jgi:hypothetical protein
MITLKAGVVIIVGPNLKGGLKMIRYALIYTFLAAVMAALVFVIGMPWTSRRRKTAWDGARVNHQSEAESSPGLSSGRSRDRM